MACRSLWQWTRTGMEWNQWNGVIVSYKSNNNALTSWTGYWHIATVQI